MIKAINKRMKNNKGFTLIELIVVIAILGILAAIAIPRLGGFRDSAAIKADQATARTIATATTACIADGSIDIPASSTTITLDEDTTDNENYITDLLDGGVPKPETNPDSNFVITIDDAGNVTIEVDGIDFYPEYTGS